LESGSKRRKRKAAQNSGKESTRKFEKGDQNKKQERGHKKTQKVATREGQ